MNREIEKKFLLVEDDKIFFDPNFDLDYLNTTKNVAMYVAYGYDDFEEYVDKGLDYKDYEDIFLVEQHTLSKEQGNEVLKQMEYKPKDETEIDDFRIREAHSYLTKETYYVLTMKGKGTLSRYEEEITIGEGLFNTLRLLSTGVVYKIRTLEILWRLNKDNFKRTDRYLLETDFFIDRNLVLAEIELPSENKADEVVFLGKDVTAIDLYKNKYLSNRSKNNG